MRRAGCCFSSGWHSRTPFICQHSRRDSSLWLPLTHLTQLPCSLTQHHGASSTWGPNNFSSFLFIWFALAALGLLSCSCSSVCQQAEASRLYVLACGLFLPECTGVSQPCSGEEGQVVWLLQKGPLRVLLQDKLQPNSSSWPRPLN